MKFSLYKQLNIILNSYKPSFYRKYSNNLWSKMIIRFTSLQYFYFYINNILVDVPLDNPTILIVVPSYFKLNPNKEEKITDGLFHIYPSDRIGLILLFP